MKKLFALILAIIMFTLLPTSVFASSDNIYLTVGGKTLTATLVDNAATRELKELLAKGSITVSMSDYGGFEKVGTLPQSFTTSNSNITTASGDIILYSGNQLVVFYGSNTYSYTRLGKIDGVTGAELKNILGTGNVSITLSLNSFGEVPKTGVSDISTLVIAMFALFALSAVLWGYLLHRKSV